MPIKKKKILPIEIIKLLLIGSWETKPNKQNPKDFTNLHLSSRFPRLSSIQNTTSSCLAIVANCIQSLQRGNEKCKNSCSQDIAVSSDLPFAFFLCFRVCSPCSAIPSGVYQLQLGLIHSSQSLLESIWLDVCPPWAVDLLKGPTLALVSLMSCSSFGEGCLLYC